MKTEKIIEIHGKAQKGVKLIRESIKELEKLGYDKEVFKIRVALLHIIEIYRENLKEVKNESS